MAGSFTYDVFLSHNSQDKQRVRNLAERLREAGLRVWFDEWIIKPGDDIYLAIESGLEAARVQVLCLSPAALGSDWVMLERSTVLFRDPTNKGRRFVPLMLADCTLPDTLRRYKYVDFRQETSAAFDELLTACQEEVEAVPPVPQSETKKKPEKPSEQAEPLAVLERKLTGHKGWVQSVAVSPDGKWAASGSTDKTVKIWDLETGECRATLKGHTDEVKSVAITPDGGRILSGSNDNTIRVWEPKEGKCLIRWTASKYFVLSVSIFPDSQRVLSSGAYQDPSLKVWDLTTGTRLQTLDLPAGEGNAEWSTAIARNGKIAVSSGGVNLVRLWNLETGECLATLTGHSKDVTSVQITPDGQFAVSGSDDHTVKVWDLEAKTCVGTLEGHQDVVESVAISPEGTLIASTGFTDHTIRLWDWKSGACLHVITDEDIPTSVAFSPDGSLLVVGTYQGEIFVHRLTGVRAVPAAEPTRRYVNSKVVLLGEGAVGKTSLAHR